MKLCGVEIIFVQCCTVGLYIVGYGCRIGIERHVEAVYKVDKLFVGKAVKEFALSLLNGIPPHVGDFLIGCGGYKSLYGHIEYA